MENKIIEKQKQESYELGKRHGIEVVLALVNSCDTIMGTDRHRKAADTGVFIKSVVIEVIEEKLSELSN